MMVGAFSKLQSFGDICRGLYMHMILSGGKDSVASLFPALIWC